MEKRFAIGRQGQAADVPDGLFQSEDGDCLASGKVEKLYLPIRRILSQKVNPVPSECPVVPTQTCRLIQNVDFVPAVKRYPPYTGLFIFGEVKEASVIRFDRVDTTVFCYPDRRATFKWHFP